MTTMTKTKPKAARSKPTVGSMIDQLHSLRDKRKVLDDQSKELAKQAHVLGLELIEALEAEGLDSGRGRKASVSISRTVVPSVNDWEAFHEFIRKKKLMHLLQRRPSDAACRELFEMGKSIPGVEPFEKVGINLRSL